MTKSILCFLLLVNLNNIFAQIPPPVDLGIQNKLQEQTAWCWAAVAQEIIFWANSSAPSQCDLVAAVKSFDPNICCQQPSACNTTGNLQEIQFLIARFGGQYSSIAPPANPDILYNTLCQGKAVILFLQTTPYVGHFVVLRGMEWVNSAYGPLPYFYINDPMSYFVQPITFPQLISVWRAAIVVY